MEKLICALMNLLSGSYKTTTPYSGQLSSPGQVPVNPVAVGIFSAGFIQVLFLNKARKQWVLQNTGTTVIFVKLGNPPNAGTTLDYSFALPPCTAADDGTGGLIIDDLWKGAVFVTSKTAGGIVHITEMV